ncbi:MAG TPA: slipin family protein [Longimicrobium sp.]|jgi:regulator of protease activity HflC (stomatin/prohibitin superfamily)
MPPRTDIVPASGTNQPSSPRPTAGGPNFLASLALLIPTALGAAASVVVGEPLAIAAGALVGVFASMSPKIARHWERAVVLRMGRYQGLKGPGVFTVIPFVDSITTWIDQRTVTTPFAAEQTLTADTVPVNVDAVLFWTVHDPEKAALEVQDYVQAVSWAAQTALRDIIGRTSLTELLRGRIRIETELQALIDQRSTPWGVTVHSVEMRDVVIPAVLQDAMSREAQAAREKQARIILGQAEVEIANLFAEASKAYEQNPTALQLRQMNILYEGLKQKGGMMVIPSSIVDSMGPAGVMGVASLASQQQQKQGRDDEADSPPRLPPGEGWGG